MMFLALVFAATLSRAEILARFKAPVLTQAEGLVQVFADCPEDMRREYQSPIAGFASETVTTLYRGLGQKPIRFAQPGIVIHIGEVRTNLTTVVSRVTTNGTRVVTRIYVESPGFADIEQLRLEIVKGFYRSVRHQELDDDSARSVFRATDPRTRIAAERAKVEAFVQEGKGDFDEGLRQMRKIIEPGHATRRDVLIFASRLYLYSPFYDICWLGKYNCISFREAIDFVKIDPTIRALAETKASELPIFGGGKGQTLQVAAAVYRVFLLALAQGERSDEDLKILLGKADEQLALAYEEAVQFERRNR